MESKTGRERTDELLDDLKRVAEDLEGKASELIEDEFEEFNEELELQINNIEALL